MIGLVVISLFLQNPETLFKDAKKLVEEGKYITAKEIYEKALEAKNLHPLKRYKILLELADIEMEYLNMYDEALKNILFAKSLFNENAHFQDEAYYRLGVLYEKMGNYEKAAEFYQTVVTKFRKSKYWNDAFSAIERCFAKNIKEYAGRADGIYLTIPELEKEIEKMPPFARPKDEKGKVELVDRILERKMLAKEAEKRKIYLTSSFIERMEELRENIIINVFYEEITKDIKVSPEEKKAYYLEHLDEYKIPAKYDFVRIEVKDKKVAEEIVKRIKRGEPAESLAVKYSELPDAKNGGIIRNYVMGSFPKEYYEHVKGMKENEVKGPIYLPERKNYLIIKLIAKTTEKTRPFEEVEEIIENKILNDKKREEWKKLIEELKREYNPQNYLRREEK